MTIRTTVLDAVEWVFITILAFLCMLAPVTLLDDMRKRDSLHGEVLLTFDERNTGKSTLTVHIAGILADSQESSVDQSDVWLEDSDVLYLRFSGDRFELDEGVRMLLAYLRSDHKYTHVVFNLASLGGLVGYDVVVQLTDASFTIDMFVADGATKRGELQRGPQLASLLVPLTPFGPNWNGLSRTLMDYLVVPPKEENIEPDVDREYLAASVERMRSYKLSFHHDQAAYQLTHGALKPGSLSHVRLFVYIRSLRDTDTVRASAFSSWNIATGGRAQKLEADTTHVGFRERPKEWRRVFRLCYGLRAAV